MRYHPSPQPFTKLYKQLKPWLWVPKPLLCCCCFLSGLIIIIRGLYKCTLVERHRGGREEDSQAVLLGHFDKLSVFNLHQLQCCRSQVLVLGLPFFLNFLWVILPLSKSQVITWEPYSQIWNTAQIFQVCSSYLPPVTYLMSSIRCPTTMTNLKRTKEDSSLSTPNLLYFL